MNKLLDLITQYGPVVLEWIKAYYQWIPVILLGLGLYMPCLNLIAQIIAYCIIIYKLNKILENMHTY